MTTIAMHGRHDGETDGCQVCPQTRINRSGVRKVVHVTVWRPVSRSISRVLPRWNCVLDHLYHQCKVRNSISRNRIDLLRSNCLDKYAKRKYRVKSYVMKSHHVQIGANISAWLLFSTLLHINFGRRARLIYRQMWIKIKVCELMPK